ncbi:MAG: hypothetical protein AB7V77_05465 [Candidatus Woesearchaeota archaeon]
MKKILLITMLILTIFLASCGKTQIMCPTGELVTDARDCPIPTQTNTNQGSTTLEEDYIPEYDEVVESEISPYFDTKNFAFLQRTTTPNDCIIKGDAGNWYNTYISVDYTYSGSVLNEKKVHMKVVNTLMDAKYNKVVYAGELKSGTNNLKLDLEIPYARETPKLTFCFSVDPKFDPLIDKDILCIPKLYMPIKTGISSIISGVDFKFNSRYEDEGATLRQDKDITFTNTGNTPLTFYMYADDKINNVDLTLSKTSIFLNPEESATFKVTGTFVNDETIQTGKSNIYIYAIPNKCDLSKECAEGSLVKKLIPIEIIN